MGTEMGAHLCAVFIEMGAYKQRWAPRSASKHIHYYYCYCYY
jgi:hypothetical protein